MGSREERPLPGAERVAWLAISVFRVASHNTTKQDEMTHHDPDATTIAMALELLTQEGLQGFAPAIEILINEAMRLERSAFLKAGAP